jgi:RHS repeat-associated protein
VRNRAKLIKAPEAVLKLGTDLFGDQINMYTGSVSFRHTDVSLRGNNALSVSVGRKLSVGAKVKGSRPFGRWELDIPHLQGIFSNVDGWVSQSGDTKRCSNFSAPKNAPGTNGSRWGADEFWSGSFLHVPGGEGKRMLLRAPSFTSAPGALASYPVVTSDHWTFECLPTLANDSTGTLGEGFVALSPEGTRYKFNWLHTYSASRLKKTDQLVGVLERKEVWLLPTLVTDRFGNTVRYSYDPARAGNLTKIQSSDGRVLTLTYGSGGEAHLVKTVSDATRTWTYSHYYDGAETDLDTVTLPDSSSWKLAGIRGLFYDVKVTETTKCGIPIDVYEQTHTGSMQHPAGATVSYTMQPTGHGRANVPNTCIVGKRFTQTPNVFYTNSLTNRKISGPGMADMNWTYVHGGGSSVSACGAACDVGTSVLEHDPAGHTTRYTYGNRFEGNEGKLLKVEHGWDGTSAVRTVTTRYRAAGAGPYPIEFGTTDRYMGDAGTNIKNMPVDQKMTSQQDVTFTWLADSFDGFMRTTQVTRSSTLGMSKTETTAYEDIFPKWVVGQVKSVTEASTGKVSVLNTYNASTANLETVTKFGKLQKTLNYYPDGSLWTHTDPKDQVTTYSDYKRGIPQKVVHADRIVESALVSNIGTFSSITDEAGFTTSFAYDVMGRLALVNYPVADSVVWNPTIITFAKINGAEFDIGAGHWRMDTNTGNAYKKIYFDALWRPVYSETWDSTDVAGTRRVSKVQYDFKGNATFTAYPKRSVAEISSGVFNEFDALGRPTVSRADSELGTLSTSFSYGSGFSKTETNPRQLSTTYTYQAFDEPTNVAITTIAAPEGVNVTIDRDVFGMPKSITRAGGGKSATRNYVYDIHQRLCKTIEPETGATVQDYDPANNLAWRATGLALPSTTSCDTASVPPARKMTFGYDAQNLLSSTVFGDGSPSITRTYTADGLPETISSGGSVWTNTYNKRRLNERESLVYGGVTYNIDSKYDGNASLKEVKYPIDNLTLTYNPNALGEPRQVGNYATAITYHPTGAIASFNYGNGIAHAMQPNARGLPQQSSDTGVLNDVYAYDENANVTGIADQLMGITNRTMGYDALDRLKTVSAPNLWGTASYDYDALDNLTNTTVTAGATARTTVHTIDAATNRLASIGGGPGYNLAYQYDIQGNITQRGAQSYVFDMGNRMTSAPGKATYGYDGFGRRFSVVGTDGVNRVQVYAQDGRLLYAGPTGTTGTKYIYLHKHVIAEVGGNGVKYSHTDALGSPVAQSDAAGTVVNRTRYEPYGYIAAGTANTIGFTGHVSDIDTGLTYMQQRYYDPIAGRMLSIDPVITDSNTGSSFNRYNYANNNPYRYIDPDGRFPESLEKSISQNFQTILTVAAPEISAAERNNLTLSATKFVNDNYDFFSIREVNISFTPHVRTPNGKVEQIGFSKKDFDKLKAIQKKWRKPIQRPLLDLKLRLSRELRTAQCLSMGKESLMLGRAGRMSLRKIRFQQRTGVSLCCQYIEEE